MLDTPRVSYGAAARLVLEAADQGLYPNPTDAFAFARDRGWLSKKASPNDLIKFADASRLVMASFNLKGGLLYSLFKTPHFAYRELTYRQVIQGRADPNMIVSGEQLLSVISRVLTDLDR
ncbi:MAG: hypothetical protein LBT39_02820 [Treponema sp.]|nr:hypothetical protein [Treponema sp.]